MSLRLGAQVSECLQLFKIALEVPNNGRYPANQFTSLQERLSSQRDRFVLWAHDIGAFKGSPEHDALDHRLLQWPQLEIYLNYDLLDGILAVLRILRQEYTANFWDIVEEVTDVIDQLIRLESVILRQPAPIKAEALTATSAAERGALEKRQSAEPSKATRSPGGVPASQEQSGSGSGSHARGELQSTEEIEPEETHETITRRLKKLGDSSK